MPRLLVIDDDHALYGFLAEYLSRRDDGTFEPAHAPDVESAFRLLEREAWDAVVLDVMLPGTDGFDVLRRLRDQPRLRRLPVIMLTARGEEGDRVRGLELGADDYLAKPFSPRELAARLRALLRRAGADGSGPEADARLRVDDLVVDQTALTATGPGGPISLSLLELRLIDVLACVPGETVSRKQLYQQVFGRSPFAHDRSLDMLVSRLRKKLGPRSDGGERIRAVWGEGYVFLLPGTTRGSSLP